MSLTKRPDVTPERQAYYEKIERENLSALWNVFADIVTPEPRSDCQAAVWRFNRLKTLLLEAGPLISAKEAERRVLILENPGLRGQSRITTSMYAGLQLVLPGEIAPSHRHSQSALRFIVDGKGAHTAVDGERTDMQVGDFVITPAWHWHDHGNESDEPMIWLDGLDIPVVQFFDASFSESWAEDEFPLDRPNGDSLARYGQGLLPVDYSDRPMSSPVFNYPYERTREALEHLKRAGDWDPCHGLKMRYINPVTGDSAMPTISACMQLLPRNFRTAVYRSSAATVFVPVEGSGKSTVGDMEIEWGPKDIFVVPSWHAVTHEVSTDSVLFSYSDRACQEKLGIFREQRENS
jgi:gentisate 1,2-dioxygenase